MAEEIVNRVAKSGIISLDLEKFFPEGERVVLDLKEILYQGMILREKDLRDFIKEKDWSKYKDKHVALTCTADAIVPVWAYMLLATNLNPYARTVFYGGKEEMEHELINREIEKIDPAQYKDARVVVKGCGNVPASAYVKLTNKLQPVVKVLMFGEPCSTVPVYKKPRKQK